MLEQDRREVRVLNEVPANRYLAGHVLVRVKKTVQLGHGAHMRQPDEGRNVPNASSGVSGAEKMRGWVAMRRYDISVGQARQSISGPAAHDSTKRRART